MKEGGVEGLLVVEDAPDGVEEFAHDGDDGDFGFLATGEQSLVAGLDRRAALDGHQGGQEEAFSRFVEPKIVGVEFSNTTDILLPCDK